MVAAAPQPSLANWGFLWWVSSVGCHSGGGTSPARGRVWWSITMSWIDIDWFPKCFFLGSLRSSEKYVIGEIASLLNRHLVCTSDTNIMYSDIHLGISFSDPGFVCNSWHQPAAMARCEAASFSTTAATAVDTIIMSGKRLCRMRCSVSRRNTHGRLL